MLPSIFGENLWNEFNNDFSNFFGNSPIFSTKHAMQTDVKETDNGYEIDMNLPGFKKDDIKASIKDGYLTIHADSHQDNSQKDDTGKYIRQERYSGSMQRSFYVGDSLTENDIKAKFEDGVLKLSVPKVNQKAVEAPKTIAIEG